MPQSYENPFQPLANNPILYNDTAMKIELGSYAVER